ncbi:hypothetical protein M0805_001875 [Coniferiporia weirii]|nr:hypothetical protein M0805_001875 [Coniferiporia weirii]
MSSPSCGAVPCQQLEADLYAIYYTKLVNIGSFSILVFDYLITFGREKDLVWGVAFGWGKVLFLSIRYFTLIVMTFIITGSAWTKFHWFAGVTIVMLAELTLQLRLYAMYGKTRLILFILIFTFFATFGTILSFIGRLVAAEDALFFSPIPGNELFICVPTKVPEYFRTLWVPLFVHEIILMALAVNKGIHSVRAHGKEGYVSRFTMFLVKDSVLYYFAVFGVFFSLELVWAIGGVNYIELPFGLVIVIASIMCQRLLLKIRSHFHPQSPTMRRMTVADYDSEEIVLSTFVA